MSFRPTRIAWLALGALYALGCEASAQQMRAYSLQEDLPDAELGADGGWQSAPWHNGAWLEFPGGATVEVEHSDGTSDNELGRQPASVHIYVAFEGDGCQRGDDAPSAALAAGDLARIVRVTGRTVTLKNNTTQGLCLRLVLR